MADYVEIEGGPELRRALRQAGSDLADLKDVNAAVAEYVAQVSAFRAPHRSGSLAVSIRGNRSAKAAVITAGNSSVKYAAVINYGWPKRHIRGNPFIVKAARETESHWVSMYTDGVQRVLDNIGKAAP